MKIVLIQPYYKNIWEALGIGYISSYCKKNYKNDLTIKCYQCKFDNDDYVINECIDADIVGFSCTSPSFKHGVHLARKIKKINKNVRTIFGGWHITALKEKCLVPEIDQIVIGEGEKAFLDILNGNKNKVVYGVNLPFNELPPPDRIAIKNERTIDLCESMIGTRIASFQAHRGCPMKCAYCSERCMTGIFNKKTNPIRTRDIDDTLDEIDEVVNNYKLDYFKFVDATFDVDPKWVIEFCKRKIERNINTEWECMIHASFAEENMFEWLKKANCNQVDIGCESGSSKVLKMMNKGTTTEIIKKVFKWAKNYNIKRRAFFIIGMPDELDDDIYQTYKFAKELETDVIGFTILCPYPGGDFYNHETMKDIKWEDTDEYSNDFWKSNTQSNQQLKAWQKFLTDSFNNLLCERQNEITNSN